MTNKDSHQSSVISHQSASPEAETEIVESEGGSESAAGDILFVPPVDESDVSDRSSVISEQPAPAELQAESPKSEVEPESENAARNVSFVPPVDESNLAHRAGEGQQDSTEDERTPAPATEEIRAAIEAILYAAGEPVTIRELKKTFSGTDPEDIKKGLEEILEAYNAEGRGLQLVEVAGGYQITTRPEYHDWVRSIFKFKPPSRLSIQALETLATIAYRQPVTVPEIMELRGVNSAGVVRTLLEKKLIRILGRKKVVGRPLLYGTTKEFLTRFGLKDMSELPRLEDMAEVFGEDLSVQLEEALGEKEASTASAAGSSDDSPDGDVSSGKRVTTGDPTVSDVSPLDQGEADEGEGEKIEGPE
jgi:segregation and condensation protein B